MRSERTTGGRQAKRDESNKCDADQLTQPTPESLRKWALDVIQYYVSLWDFAKVTPLVTIHKKKLFSHLMSSDSYGGIITDWIKADGYIDYRIEGILKKTIDANGRLVHTSSVTYEFYDESYGIGSRSVQTADGTYYMLHEHYSRDKNISVSLEKKLDLIKFRVIYGVPPIRPVC